MTVADTVLRLKAEAEYLVGVVQRVPADVAVLVVMDALVGVRERTQDETLAAVDTCLRRVHASQPLERE